MKNNHLGEKNNAGIYRALNLNLMKSGMLQEKI
jgi:hypothetical protein